MGRGRGGLHKGLGKQEHNLWAGQAYLGAGPYGLGGEAAPCPRGLLD